MTKDNSCLGDIDKNIYYFYHDIERTNMSTTLFTLYSIDSVIHAEIDRQDVLICAVMYSHYMISLSNT